MFSNQYSLNGTEIDHTFHLKPLLTASIFHDTFARLSYELEVSAIHLHKTGLSWVLSDMHLEFTGKLPFWRDSYAINVWIRRNQQVRIFSDFTATDIHGNIFARGTGIWLVIDRQTRQPVMRPDIFDKFEVENKAAVPGFRFPILQTGTEVVGQENMRVLFNDLDFNLHLNSVRYLGGAVEALGSRFLLGHKLKTITVKYLKEVLCDEQLLIKATRVEGGFSHQIINAADEEVCRFFSSWIPA